MANCFSIEIWTNVFYFFLISKVSACAIVYIIRYARIQRIGKGAYMCHPKHNKERKKKMNPGILKSDFFKTVKNYENRK